MISLDELQKWFGALVGQPLQPNNLLPPTTPFGTDTLKEAAAHIAPSPTLLPFERLQIYHQQYWWRLLKCMQQNFPMVVRLFGFEIFNNRLVIPYLTAHPPSHWALFRLGETFVEWLAKHYQEDDCYLVQTAACIDWATGYTLWAPSLPKVDFAALSPDETLSKELRLQPSLHLFHLKADFFSFREEFLKHEVEHYNTHPFPEMSYGESHFVLYRTPKNMLSWKKISEAEAWMLTLFREGSTIEQACSELEKKGGEILEEATSQIPFWFKQWTVLEWVGSSSSS